MIKGDLERYKRRKLALDTEFSRWKTSLKDIRDHIAPTRGMFDDNANKGQEIDHQTILSGWPMDAAEKMAAGLLSGLTSPSRPWFKLGVTDPDMMEFGPVKEYLDAVERQLMAMFAGSNIYGFLYSQDLEVGIFGTAGGLILSDSQDVIRGYNYTAGEYTLGTSATGRVDTCARTMNMTAAQLVEMFGLENVSQTIRMAYNNREFDNRYKIHHLLEPNYQRNEAYEDNQNMPWMSCYWEDSASNDDLLRKSGFRSFPALAPRWDVARTSDVYGYGPGWKAAGDTKSLYKSQFDKLAMLDLLVTPPLQTDSSTDEDDAYPLPGSVTRNSASAPNGGLRPVFEVNPPLSAVQEIINEFKTDVGRAFYYDLFNAITQLPSSRETAFEIAKRYEENLQMLGPILDRLKSEQHDPLIHRAFDIGLQIPNYFPDPPDELQDVELKIEYISTLAQAQKAVNTSSIERTVSFAGNLIAVEPSVADNINWDRAVNIYASANGTPSKVIRTSDEVDAIRKQRAKQQAMAKAEQDAAATVQGAKVLSETPIGQNSALDLVIGQ